MEKKTEPLGAADQPDPNALGALIELARAFAPNFGMMLPTLLGNASASSTASTPEERLRKVEARYQSLVEQMPAVTFMASFENGLSEVYVSPHIEALLGYTAKEWIDDPILWYMRLHPDDRTRWTKEFSRTVSWAESFKGDYRFLAKDGRVVWIHGEAKVVRDASGRPSFVQGIGYDITEQKETEEVLRRSREELERSNFELQQFARITSHDLQSPLRNISGFAQLLKASYEGRLDAEADDWIGRIVRSCEHLSAMIQDVLAYSRVDAQTQTFAPVALRDVFNEALGLLEVSIRDACAEVTRDELPTVIGDRTQLVQLLQNLVENGLKYRGQEPPRIHVSARHSGEEWIISVHDNGIGIAPKYHDQIFEIFKRLHNQQEYSGTGLGLAVCRRIVHRHQGRIWVESEFGQGSTFHFTLPDRKMEKA